MTDDRRSGLAAGDQWIERVLESSAAKTSVVVLIVLSLTPTFDRMALHFFLYLPLFGAEFLLRLRLFFAHRRLVRRRLRLGEPVPVQERRRWEPLLLALDFVAVLSFLPLGHLFDSGRLLRLARLVRLVLVVRYAAALVRDFWLVVTRRERLGQLLTVFLTAVTLAFVAAALLLYAEPKSPIHEGRLLDSFWWAFLQIESGDNLVRTLHQHPAVVAASVLLTLTGIFLMAFVIGLGTNIVGVLVVAARHRPVDLEGHTVVASPALAARRILRDLRRLEAKNVPEALGLEGLAALSPARRLRRWLGRRRVVLAGPDPEPPPFLLDPALRRVIYRPTALADPRAVDVVSADEARRVVLVPDEADPAGDDRCLSSALAVSEAMVREAADDAGRRDSAPRDLYLQVRRSMNAPAAERIWRRLHDAGIGCQLLDMEKLIGRFLAQHVLDPGLDPVFDEILATNGNAIWVRLLQDDVPARAPRRPLPALVPHALAWRRYRTIPLGLLTGPPTDAGTPHAASTLWRTHGCETQLGLGPGTARPPVERLAGFVALAPAEPPVQSWARDLASGRLEGHVEPEPPPAALALADSLVLAAHDAHRVLLVGDHPSLAALVLELIRFLPGIEIRVLPEHPAGEPHEFGASLEAALRRFDPGARVAATDGDLEVRLADGKAGRVGPHAAPGVAATAHLTIDTADLAAFDRVVLLSDPGDPGSDDRTTVRLLRFADAIRCREGCRLVVQVESESRAVLLTDALKTEASPDGSSPLSVLAAEQVRAHFLAHAVLTPGLVPVLDELLAERGQEFVRLVPRAGTTLPHDPVGFDELLVALGRRGPGSITAIGWVVDRRDGPHSVLNPPPDVPPPLADEVRAVFAVADTSLFGASHRA